MIQTLRDLSVRNWKQVGARYEPVGSIVLVLTASGEILKAKRKTPAESYGKPNSYFRVDSDEVVIKPTYWDYP